MASILFRLRSKFRNTLYHMKIAKWGILRKYNASLNGSRHPPYFQLLSCSWKHGASFKDFYELRFYEKNNEERKSYITASLRHELTRQVNDSSSINILKDKKEFSRVFKDLLGRRVYSWDEVCSFKVKGQPPKLVIKQRFGQAGNEVIFPERFASWSDLTDYMKRTYQNPSMYIFEEYILQHHLLGEINPSCVNTLRVVSYYNDNNDVEIWGVYLRMGVEKSTDNLSTGGIAALVDKNGFVCRSAVKKNPFAQEFMSHPATNKRILGFEVPHYSEAISLVIEAARRIKKIRSIGWDVAIIENGPCIIEGNDNWSMTLFQIPCGQGLRFMANAVCDMKKVYD